LKKVNGKPIFIPKIAGSLPTTSGPVFGTIHVKPVNGSPEKITYGKITPQFPPLAPGAVLFEEIPSKKGNPINLRSK